MTDERFIQGENGVPRPNPALPREPPEAEPEEFRGEPFALRVASYLLGQMSEEEAEEFEDLCFAQEHWPSRIEAVEEDLIDAYLHGELDAERRALFERNYLTTAARQERVRVAAGLLRQVCVSDVVDEPSVVEHKKAERVGLLGALWGGGWGLRAAWVAAALVVVVGGSWLYLSRVRTPRAVATLTLTSSVISRSVGVESRTIKLPPDADALRVFLVLPERAVTARSYRVELDDQEGKTVSLPVEGQDAQAVSVLIPASRIPRGQYALTLFAVGNDGTEQPVHGSYIFTVE
jgi:hypothetical protein